MRIRLRLYALLRDLYGASEDLLDIDKEKITVKELLEILSAKNPKMRNFIESRGESIIVLVNGLYAPLESFVKNGDTIDILPPASGGSL